MLNLKEKLLWLWQLPQNLCGVIYRSVSKDNRISIVENDDSRSVGAKVFLQKSNGGVTLGKYIFIYQDYTDKAHVIKHECGHVIYSNSIPQRMSKVMKYEYWMACLKGIASSKKMLLRKRVKTADLQAAKDEFDPFETLETPQTLDIDPFEASGTLKDLTKKKQETTSKIDEEAEEIFVFENDIFDGLETSDSGTEDTDKEGKRPSTGIIKDIDTVDVFIEDPFAEDLPATAANKKN